MLLRPGVTVTSEAEGLLEVSGLSAEEIGDAAWKANLPLHELTNRTASLEDAFMQMTHDAVEYRNQPIAKEAAA